ncbi:NUDIX hydrolase [Algivirga pacifica]|uniref:NUDIX domain-containing protein n=1 Tax=Algivirga pacifica TaxID=1162670 RepID=A0ABP9DH53_9BACT
MKFFVEDTAIEIRKEGDRPSDEHRYVTYGNISADSIWKHYCQLRDKQVQGHKPLLFYVKDYTKTVKQVSEHFKVVHAAGGLVSKEDTILFMHRRDKWDLPKGHVDAGEEIEEAAVREVMEECQVEASLGEKVGETWHTYVLKGKDILKCTHWYSMHCTNDSDMKPQEEEDITALRWMTREEVKQEVWKNTFASIKEIYEIFERR